MNSSSKTGYWLIIHSGNSYEMHNDLIGFIVQFNEDGKVILDDDELPKSKWRFRDLKIGHKIVYYATGKDTSDPKKKYAILGTFKIVEGPIFDPSRGYFREGSEEDPLVCFRITPLSIPKKRFAMRRVVDELDLFAYLKKDEATGQIRNYGQKLHGRAIIPLSDQDFQTIESEIQKINSEQEEVGPPRPKPDEIPAHIRQIALSHELATDAFPGTSSYLGRNERSRVEKLTGIPSESLPDWLSSLSQAMNRDEIEQIDNIYLFEEDPTVLVPKIVWEHEISGDLRGVFSRFIALRETLETTRRYGDIRPCFVIVAKDEEQQDKYQRKIDRTGRWKDFTNKYLGKFHILTKSDLEERSSRLIRLVFENLHS